MPTDVSALIALEIHRILRDLSDRRRLLVELWSMHRDRWPMAEAAFSRWRTLRQPELDTLAPEVVVALDSFYAELEAWHDYVARTEDMPLHLDDTWLASLETLTDAAEGALHLLGEAPISPVPVGAVAGRPFLEAFALRRTDLGSFRPDVVHAEE